ncbi:MAG TPA: O-antigen ligase family protein [Vicinamibacterales bacterium]|nr:O-antigen ligase family protein [Vicinamibacterales bacterium]
MELTSTRDWWRPSAPAVTVQTAVTTDDRDRIAFGALAAFTIILLVSPQAWFPAIKSFRIALLAAGVAIAAHVGGRMFGVVPAMPLRREMVVALALISWAALTVPLSIWPGGSWEQLTDHLIKAVIFFWLIGTLITTLPRLRVYAWILSLCSVPLALTAINNYLSGVVVTHADSAVQRIAGYMGGSGLAANPNDLALMLNLLMPFTGALLVTAGSVPARIGLGLGLLLSVVAVIATFSRAGFITLALIGALALLAMLRRGAVAMALAVVLLAAVALAAMPAKYYERLSTITNIEADPTGSAQGRWEDWILSVEYIGKHPMTGAGLGQDLLALNAERGHETWRSVHNAFLQIAVDLGFPGLLLLLLLLFMSLGNARRVRRRAARIKGLGDLETLAQAVSISLAAFVVAAFFHPIAYQFYFFCLAGLAVALVNVERAHAPVAP